MKYPRETTNPRDMRIDSSPELENTLDNYVYQIHGRILTMYGITELVKYPNEN